MIPDHRPRNRQALPGALADGLGGKEGFKDPWQYRGRNAAAGVGYFEPYARAVGAAAYGDGAAPLAALLDRMRGIDDEVQEYLVDFGTGAVHGRNVAEFQLHLRGVLVFAARDHEYSA